MRTGYPNVPVPFSNQYNPPGCAYFVPATLLKFNSNSGANERFDPSDPRIVLERCSPPMGCLCKQSSGPGQPPPPPPPPPTTPPPSHPFDPFAMMCGTSTAFNANTGRCEIACGNQQGVGGELPYAGGDGSGRRMQAEANTLTASTSTSTRELVSAYMTAHPTFNPGKLDDDLNMAHLEKLAEQLFGQPALA